MFAFPKKLIRACGAIGVILVSLSLGAGTVAAQTCLEDGNVGQSALGGRVAADGVIEFTYRVVPNGTPGSLSDMIHYAVLEAIARWNAETEHTNVRFVPAPNGFSQDLLFRQDDTINDACGEIDPSDQVISLTWQLWNIAREHGYGYEWAVATAAHEIAHFLCLGETGSDWSTIMGNPTQVQSCDAMRDEWEAGNGPTTIYPWLAWAAQQCFDDHRETYTSHAVPHYGSAYYEWEQQSCGSYVYEFWDYYVCINGECQFWYTTWFYLGCF